MLKVFESLETANMHGGWHHPLFENLARVVVRSASRLRKAGKPGAAIELLDRILPERVFSSSRADDKIDLVFAWGQQLDNTSENLALLEEMADILAEAPPRPGQQHQFDIGRAGQLLTASIQVDAGRDEALLRLADLMWRTRERCKSNSYGSDFFYTRMCQSDETIKSLYVQYAQAAGDKTKAYVVKRLGFDPSKPRKAVSKQLPAADPGYAWRTFSPNPAVEIIEIECDENTPSGREFLTRIKARNCRDFRYGNHSFSKLKASVRIPEDMRIVATAERLTPTVLRWSEANRVALKAPCVGGLPEGIVHLQCDPKVAISPVILARLNKLETLDIPKFRENYGPVVEALQKLPKLRTLRIERLREPETTVPLIASLEGLETLDLQISHESEDPTIFRHLSKLQALRDFRITAFLPVVGLTRALSELTQLRSLSIRSKSVQEDELVWLAKLESLERLELQIAFSVKSQGVLALAQLPNLHTLDLENSAATDADIADVAQLSQLRALGVSGTHVTHFGIESIGRMRNLVVLHMNLEWNRDSYIAAPGSAVNPLRNLTQLRHLNARLNTMEGREVAEIVALKQLRSLNVQYTRWTDRSELEVLEKLPNLKVLFAEPSGQLSREKFREWADSVKSFDIVGR
jgi:Leucine-rich repeat (LRR) protein